MYVHEPTKNEARCVYTVVSRFGTSRVIPNAGGSNQVAVALVNFIIPFVGKIRGGKQGCCLVGDCIKTKTSVSAFSRTD